MPSVQITAAAQGLEIGDKIELFQLDLSPLGISDVVYFSASCYPDGRRLVFQGNEYAYVEVETSGWEMTGQGAFPQPKIKVNNAREFFNGLTINYGDVIGARLMRLRTYLQFLDGQANADPQAIYDPDIYNVDQKVQHNKNVIEWKLSAASDQAGVMLPKRRMWRDTCAFKYRIYNAETHTFDYSQADCPWTQEGPYFDEFGQPTTRDKDECGLRLADCRKRFAPPGAQGNTVPYEGFPGLLRNTIS